MGLMSEEDMMKKFDGLYGEMAESKNIENMKLFGRACRKAVGLLATHMPTMAMEIIDELCAVNWDNYITDREREAIVRSMEPEPKWSYEQVKAGLSRLDLPMEEAPHYNCNAMYVTISMKYSDSGKTVAERLLKKPLGAIDELEMLEACYYLAHDVLTDKDKMFRIRKYFSL